MSFRSRWGIVSLCAIGCSEYAFNPPKGTELGGEGVALALRPRALDFLAVQSGERAELSAELANIGPVDAQVFGGLFEGDPDFGLVSALPERLGVGEAVEVTLAFEPSVGGERSGRFLVHSDDADEPEMAIDLLGTGLLPALRISPMDYDFGDLILGCPQSLTVSLENVGEADLTVSEIVQEGEGFRIVEAPELPATLAPGVARYLSVEADPGSEGPQSSQITVRSDDPSGEQVAVQRGQGTWGGDRQEEFVVSENSSLDLLFLVDQSCSMDDDAAALADNFDRLVDGLAASDVDWQVGVVTTDSGCVNDALFSAGTVDLLSRFREAVTLGEDVEIADDEALLRLADRAVGLADECNVGLLRPDGLLHVVVISDEPERSVEQAAAWTWDFWVDRLRSAIYPRSLLISGVVDRDDCNEGDDGYAEAIAATGGLHLSICGADWGSAADDLALRSVAASWEFHLAEDPVPGSITVSVDGVEETGWTWDAMGRTLRLTPRSGGGLVVVDYSVGVPCE